MRSTGYLLVYTGILCCLLPVESSTEQPKTGMTNSPPWAIVPSAVIAGLGVVFNLISLSYFIRREHASLGSRLLMLLNGLDLLVCVTGVAIIAMLVNYYDIGGVYHETVQSMNFIFLEATGFATFLLSVTRCISLCVPFYIVKGHCVAVAAALFVGYTAIREITLVRIVNRETYNQEGLYKIHMGCLFSEVGLMILAVLLANTICVLKILLKSAAVVRSRAACIHATITVIILSAFFCALNVFYLVTEVLYFFYGFKLNRHNIAGYFGIFYAVPLNSAINPLIYLLRKKEMRRYLQNPFLAPRPRQCTHVGNPTLGTVESSRNNLEVTRSQNIVTVAMLQSQNELKPIASNSMLSLS